MENFVVAASPEHQRLHVRFEVVNKPHGAAADGYEDSSMDLLPIVLHVYQYPAITRELYSELFWTRRELKLMSANQRRLAREYEQLEPELVEAIHYNYLEINNSHNHRTSNEDDPASRTSSSLEDPNDTPSPRILAESDCRGLEALMTPLIGNHRKWAVTKLLSMQKRYRANQTNNVEDTNDCHHHPTTTTTTATTTSFDADIPLDTNLRVWSERLSADACHYARQIAKGDEEEQQKQQRQRQKRAFERRNAVPSSLLLQPPRCPPSGVPCGDVHSPLVQSSSLSSLLSPTLGKSSSPPLPTKTMVRSQAMVTQRMLAVLH